MFGEQVPERGNNSVDPGPVLGPEWWTQERRAEAARRIVVMEQVSELIYVVFEGEVAVKKKNVSEFADVWGGGQSGDVDGEAEVVSGFGEGDDEHDHV